MITEGSMVKTFFFLSIPGFMMVFIQAGVPIIDGLIIYNYDNAVSGAAISYATGLQNVFIAGAQGIATAGSSIIGQTNGRGDLELGKKYAGQLVSLSFIVGLILIPLIMLTGYFFTMNLDAELKSKVFLYNSLYCFAIPFILIFSSYSSVKTVFGHPEASFVRSLLFMPIKLFYSVMFIIVAKMGIAGAGLSAICSYATICIFMVYDMFIKDSSDKLSYASLKIQMSFFKKLFKVCWAAVVQNSTKSLSFFLVRAETARYGDVALSAQGISGDITNAFQSLANCFDAAIISSVSINSGAGNGERAKQFAKFAIRVGLVISIVSAVCCMLIAPLMLRYYTQDPEILKLATWATIISCISFPAFSIMFNQMPVFIALGLNKASLFIQTMRIWVVRLAALYLLYLCFDGIGVYAVFISLSIANICGAVISQIIFGKVSWVKNK